MTSKGIATTDDLPATLSVAERKVLKQFESEIASGILDANRAAAVIGKALWDIQDEALWRESHATFADYALTRWGLSRSRAYRFVQIAKEVAAHPGAPIPAQWQLEPGKVAAKAAPRPPASPTRGTDEAPAPVIDAEGWDAAGDVEADAGGEPEAGEAQAEATAEDPSLTPVVASAAQLPPHPPTAVGGENPDEISHATEQWAVTPADVLARLAETKPDTRCPSCPYDGDTVGSHAEGCELVAGQVYRQTGIATSPMTGAVALMSLLQSLDLDALGQTLTAVEMDTLTKAYEQISVAYSVAHPSPLPRMTERDAGGRRGRPAEPKPRKVVAKKASPVKAAAKDSDACDHPKVAGHPAKTKGKWSCELCGEEVDVAKVSA